MLRKIASAVVFLAFFYIVLFVSVLKVSRATTEDPIVTGKETSLILPGKEEGVSLPTAKLGSSYYLPYPGILPDHPLYFLKMIRDRIWFWLTIDPLKKAEVLILFADKRLGAGKFLIEGGKVNLGLSTLEKAEKYLERAAAALEGAGNKGEEAKLFSDNLKKAASKHEEVLVQIKESLSEEKASSLEKLLVYPRVVLEKTSQNTEE